MKVFGYCRVSSTGQSKDSKDGFPRQREAIRGWAKLNSATIAQWFEDSITGKTELESRPALTALLVALSANGIRTVVIEKLDRLARDLMVQESIIADFRRKNITLISVMEPDLCSDDPTRVLLRQMMGAFAQYERSTIVAKLRGARQRKREQTGRCEGRKPYGVRPGESAILERMKALREAGGSYESITAQLNAAGLLSRSGKPWIMGSVHKILTHQ